MTITRRYLIVLISLLAFSMVSCGSLPDLAEREASYAVPASQTADTALGQIISAEPSTNAGVIMLGEAKPALDARLMLIGNAEKSIDMQYYIWRNDISGQLIAAALQQAAYKGVRVRLLLDDFHSTAIAAMLHQLNAHPNIQVRLVNPFMPRGSKLLGMLTDFKRANRRMHNKSLTADNRASIVGGRNIGDDYFLRGESDVLFADLDLLAVGDIVSVISHEFDNYWNSDAAYPLELLEPETAAATTPANSPIESRPPQELEAFFQQQNITWANATLVSDAPNKMLDDIEPEDLITSKIKEIIDAPTEEVLIVSPYFIPTKAGVKSLQKVVDSGVQISVLTNAFATNDVALVHSGYAKWRKQLLQAGVRLFELRPTAIPNPPIKDDEDPTFSSSSASSLHAKTFVIDRHRVFVGSFNFDPRSINLNTEMGLVVDSEALGSRMAETFNRETPSQAYQVILSDSGDLVWLERDADGNLVERHTTEPGSSWFSRLAIGFFSLLPIDSFL